MQTQPLLTSIDFNTRIHLSKINSEIDYLLYQRQQLKRLTNLRDDDESDFSIYSIDYLMKSAFAKLQENKKRNSSLNYTALCPQELNKLICESDYRHLKECFDMTNLMVLSVYGLSDLAQFYTFYQMDVEKTDDRGNTALLLASAHGNTQVAKNLICSRAKINHQNTYGTTALMNAVLTDNIDLAKFLLENGANPLLRDISKHTAFSYTMDSNNSEMADMLSIYTQQAMQKQAFCGKTY